MLSFGSDTSTNRPPRRSEACACSSTTGVAEALGAIVAGTSELSPGLAMGLALLTTGVAFKIAAVPFHEWTPDAYQG